MTDVWKQANQQALADLAFSDQDADIRRAAAGRLIDQSLLRRLVMESKDVSVHVIAVWKLDDVGALAGVAKNDAVTEVRQAAINRQAIKLQ